MHCVARNPIDCRVPPTCIPFPSQGCFCFSHVCGVTCIFGVGKLWELWGALRQATPTPAPTPTKTPLCLPLELIFFPLSLQFPQTAFHFTTGLVVQSLSGQRHLVRGSAQLAGIHSSRRVFSRRLVVHFLSSRKQARRSVPLTILIGKQHHSESLYTT